MSDVPTAALVSESGPTVDAQARVRVYERFNLHHRIQHFFMAFPFTMLIITGWPLRFPELVVSKIGCSLVGGVEVVGILHRIFGVMLVGVSIYHAVYLVVMFLRGQRSVAMLPSFTDAKEAWGDILYFLGVRDKRPRFSRYNWIEKVEYYAVIWGTVVMILSGIIIWIPQIATKYLPSWVVPASVIVHGYEALLAGLAIFLWHFYWVHLHPSVYPMSMVWLTGKLTEEEMEHHHPRELEMLKERERKSAEKKR
ncbi:cytochrome b/b6 domain-containing protein [bacterium]|nr:cytochrome b/b6 domain-containing protein [bacterium]